jgi:hypothetical protein
MGGLVEGFHRFPRQSITTNTISVLHLRRCGYTRVEVYQELWVFGCGGAGFDVIGAHLGVPVGRVPIFSTRHLQRGVHGLPVFWFYQFVLVYPQLICSGGVLCSLLCCG